MSKSYRYCHIFYALDSHIINVVAEFNHGLPQVKVEKEKKAKV